MFNHQLIYSLLFFLPLIATSLATTKKVANPSNDEVLEWVKNDSRRFLRTAIKVGDLNQTIGFYTECFGMKVLRKTYDPKRKSSKAVLGFGPEKSHFVLELHQIYGEDKLDIGTAFGHFAIATQNVSKMVEVVRAKGAVIIQEPGTISEGNTSFFYAFVQDPNGYIFELIQRESTPEPLCQIMFRVADMDRAIQFYQKALGLNVLLKFDIPRDRVAISTNDVYKSAKAVKLVTNEIGGKITRPPGPIPKSNTKITAFIDPDGQKTVLVDNKDYLKELIKKNPHHMISAKNSNIP